ncbi:MAG: glycosyltransferase [Anaerolineae bacterium]|nr:glycosyltransferase [Anaerolineae bacterium]
MKICLLPRFRLNQIGGVARHVLALERHLVARGHEIVSNPTRADLVHVHAAAQAPVVDVYTNHGIHPIRPEMESWKAEQNRVIFDNLKLAREVIAVSQWTADQWRHLVGREPHIIPNGIDLEEWRDIPRGVWRSRLGVDERTPIVLWGKSRVDDVCDPTPALELALRCPDTLVVLTAPPRAFVHLPHNVRAVGPQMFPSMQMLLADCDVYLATTLENHSVQVLEAMTLGKPVLGYDWGGTAETVEHGVSGLLVQPGDLNALTEAFQEAYERREELGTASREIVAERYRWDQLIEDVEFVYEEALTGKLAEADPHRPKVSIVIPVYNKAPYVREAVESALQQRVSFPYEVIVVDDGSTDGSAEVLEQLADERPELVVIHQENAGVAAARNRGIQLAMGRYICCLDGDDAIDPLFLERTTAALDADPGLGIAYTDMLVFGDWPGRGKWQHVVRADEYDFERLKKRNFIPCCNLFRRVAWERAGGYKDINPSWEDYELWLNMGKLGWYGRRVPGPLFRYRKLYQEGRDHESHGREWLLRATINRLHRDLYPPMVSVVIPCYGQSRFLREAIDSALAQTFPDVEAVVVDDGNGDEEAVAIQRIVSGYPAQDVRLIRHEENRGLAAARNTGIEAARGSWIVPLDADDVIEPTFVEKCLRAVELDPRRFAYTDSLLWWPDEGRTQLLKAHEYDFGELLRRITWSCTILYAKDAWRQVGGYKPEMSESGGWEDWEFAISLGEVGICGVHVPEPLFRYRQYSKTQMRYAAEEHKERLRERLRQFHAAVYRGERPMGCCGRNTRRIQTTDRVSGNGKVGQVLVKYVGDHVGTMQWRTPSGRVYSFGAADPLKWMSPEDAEHFADLPDFVIIPR